MKLTQTGIAKAKLPAGKAEAFYWDDEMPGFGLRLRSGGSRIFVIQYKVGAKHRRITLGSASKITADDARKSAKRIFGKLADGKDPANERVMTKAQAALTLGAAVEDFIKRQEGHVRPRTLEETARYLRKHWKPLHGLGLASITRAHVAAEANKIATRSGPVAADRARAALSSFFGWAMGEGLVQDNPVMGTNRAAPAETREHTLTDAEIVTVWNAADAETDFGKIVRLLFTTACRRDEIGKLKPSEIALANSLIALPGERTKNGRPHDVPLSGLAMGVVESLDTEGEGRVFGLRGSGFSGWSKAKRELDAKLEGVRPWTLHDIRRTVATGMATLGVQPHIVEAVLNHVSGHKRGVAGVYNRATYDKEKRAAMDAWASHLQTLLSGATNVRRFARKTP